MDVKKTIRTSAIIVAAGKGRRLNAPVAKQYLEIAGRPILWYTLGAFQASESIDEIIVVLPAADVERMTDIIRLQWKIEKATNIIAGGQERYHSVWAGLQAVHNESEVVLIHDGVRPFVHQRLIRDSVTGALRHGAVIVAVTPKDTVKVVVDRKIHKTLDRNSLVLVQTPQAFRRPIIEKAYQRAFADNEFSTDDSALVERLGFVVHVLPGDYENIKITSAEDVLVAEALLKRRAVNR